MPITKPVLTLYGGLLLAWFIMLGVQVSGGGGFLLPLIASTLATLAHVGLGIWWIAQKVRGNPRSSGPGSVRYQYRRSSGIHLDPADHRAVCRRRS